jgi:outer membrane lipoprotein-sorting protein
MGVFRRSMVIVFMLTGSFTCPAVFKGDAVDLIQNIENSERKITDMQARVRWYHDSAGNYVDYEWAYKNGMEYRKTSNKYTLNKKEGVADLPIEQISFNGEKQFAYASSSDRSVQRGGVYGVDMRVFAASLMPRVLLGYDLLDTLSDKMKKAEEVSVLEQEEIIGDHRCTVVEVRNLQLDKTVDYSQNLKVWIDCERDYRPLKIEVYRNSDPSLPWNSLIRRIHNIKLTNISGIWFPVSGDIEYYKTGYVIKSDGRDVSHLSVQEAEGLFGKMTQEQVSEVVDKRPILRGEVQRIEVFDIRLNEGIDDQEFVIQFPKGCIVWDDFLQYGYQVGSNKVD